MIDSVKNALNLPDLRRRIFFTLGILILYRLVANIPVPGVNVQILSTLAERVSSNRLIDVLDLLSGGAVSNFSVMAMGVYPYITASIIIQLLTPIIPIFEEWQSEGESGRNRLNRITYYLTIPLALVQAIGQINLIGLQFGSVESILPHFGLSSAANILPTLTTLMAMTGGTMFAIWLGELITKEGVGQGVSLIIFSGIVARIPFSFGRMLRIEDSTARIFSIIAFFVITLITLFIIVVVQEGERRIPVQYGRRVRGRKVYQGQNTYVPLKVNTAGMIPIIFAQSIITFPGIFAQLFVNSNSEWLKNFATSVSNTFGNNPGVIYWFLLFIFVVGFTFFYTDVMVAQQNLPQTLQRQGGFIPGIRPGPRTKDYITSVVRRITLVGALFLGVVAVLPGIMQGIGSLLNLPDLQQSVQVIGGSGLIIVVGVVIDTMRQLEAQLLMRHYEGFIR